MKSKVLKGLHIVLLLIISIGLVAGFFIKIKYPATNFDELYFYFRMGFQNADKNVYIHSIKYCLPFIILLIVILYALFYDITFGKKTLKIKNKVQLYPVKIVNNHRIIFTILYGFLAVLISAYNIGVIKYVYNRFADSGFIEKYYEDSRKVDVEFKEKRNLIFIISESLETTTFSEKHGGYWDFEVMPELYELLNDEDSVVFYDQNKAQGVKMLADASWTTASLVANMGGVPFKIPIEGNSYHSDNFMNGLYTLGDLLKDNGYHNEVISAAKTSFGGLKEFFTKHGKYDIIDCDSVEKYGLHAGGSDRNGWGLFDKYVFESAKERLKKLSKSDEPFNLEIVTIDTHFPDGVVGDYTETKYKQQYENVYATESKMIGEFVDWVKQQDFYENTTIVIIGDHLSMQHDFFEKKNPNAIVNQRFVYNCIINPAVKPKKTSGRQITAIDYYPTVVAAIGGEIKGNKLGLGVNLFSERETLSELYGFEYINNEFKKKSDFYDNYILDDKNIKKLKKAEEEEAKKAAKQAEEEKKAAEEAEKKKAEEEAKKKEEEKQKQQKQNNKKKKTNKKGSR